MVSYPVPEADVTYQVGDRVLFPKDGPPRLYQESFSEEVTRSIVDHPPHYGGADNPYEAIKVIEAWDLGFCLGNTVKYIARCGRKTVDPIADLEKARWYLDRHIARLKGASE